MEEKIYGKQAVNREIDSEGNVILSFSQYADVSSGFMTVVGIAMFFIIGYFMFEIIEMMNIKTSQVEDNIVLLIFTLFAIPFLGSFLALRLFFRKKGIIKIVPNNGLIVNDQQIPFKSITNIVEVAYNTTAKNANNKLSINVRGKEVPITGKISFEQKSYILNIINSHRPV